MIEENVHSENLSSRLRRLMLARVLILTFLLGIATFVGVKGMESLSYISASTLFKTILLTYTLSILYLFLLKYIRNIPVNIYIQSIFDVILITVMVYATGGIRSIYSVFYPLVIIYGVLFLGRRGGIIIASAAGIFYGLFADLEFYGVIYPLYAIPIPDHPLDAGYFFTRIAIHILSFYLIAVLTSFVVEQEKKARTLLAKEQRAFDQLALLHRSIIESLDTGIVTVNLAGQIKSFNRAAVEITGFKFKEIENREISEVFKDVAFLAPKQSEGGQTQPIKTRFESPFRTRDGKNLLLGCSVSPLKSPQGITIGNIIIFQDLTTINEMRESLEKSRKLAFAGEVAAGLAHEIRNPLASISGSIQMLKQELTLNETNEKLMQIILRGKDQLESFLRDFLLMARPAPGVREQIDVRETIRDVLDSIRCVPDWQELHDVALRLPDDPLLIQANKTEIRQILWNIILNALQAMPEGGMLTVEALFATVSEGKGVAIRILDTGCGIDESGLTKIFEPFYTTRKNGTGLGLAVVNRIVEGYGGKIDIQSKPRRGTTCTLWLPCPAGRNEPPENMVS